MPLRLVTLLFVVACGPVLDDMDLPEELPHEPRPDAPVHDDAPVLDDSPAAVAFPAIGRTSEGCAAALIGARTALTSPGCATATSTIDFDGDRYRLVRVRAQASFVLATLDRIADVEPLAIDHAATPNVGDTVTLVGLPGTTMLVVSERSTSSFVLDGACSAGIVLAGAALDTVAGISTGDCSAVPRTHAARGFVADGVVYPFADAKTFVAQQFTDLLGRTATAAQLDDRIRQLRDGIAAGAIVAELVRKPELLDAGGSIALLYFGALGRTADVAGYEYWLGQLRTGAALDDLVDAFASLSEFTNRHGALDDAAFVKRAYTDALGREPDAATLDTWTSKLAANTATRGDVFGALVVSSEMRTRYALDLDVTLSHLALLRASPSDAVRSFWKFQLATANVPLADLVATILDSSEYAQRFGGS